LLILLVIQGLFYHRKKLKIRIFQDRQARVQNAKFRSYLIR
jgi:hypothetical protein